ncbi:phage antirepressor N-terminal domain-containing protein [Mannheimia cairinae]|uniref:phage antirepressor N-terminal domain-containing protein n=1 Tax=Mannheimia cairinae TaxID=3025936 RepID=UPI00236318DE|nr:phage antirepressor N-terminal domain-containing protein [Mannheimia cairinae]MDD0826402.1 phage antirepressor N-terminal domain-containing protein [Mannheimia cairinae]
MTNQISTQTITFYGSELITLKVENVIYTAVRPIVDALGLSWGSQSVKLNKNKEKFNCFDIETVGADGKKREMLCMPIRKLNGWLFSINPEKVRPDLKDRVIQYQEECFEALYNYWHFGKAERKTTADERTGLRQAVSALVSKKGMIYSDAYSLIHQRFNVEHIDQLTPEQIPLAVEYMHKIYLEGELIADEPEITVKFTKQELTKLVNVWMLFTRFAESVYFLLKKASPFVHGNDYSLPELNLRWCRESIKETHPIIIKLMEALPKEQLFHNSRQQIRNRSDF